MKQMDIEKLLSWAYREELPKERGGMHKGPGYGNGWGGVAAYGELLAVVDVDAWVNRHGVVPDSFGDDDPHPDALLISQAVLALDDLPLEIPEGWNCLADFGDLGDLGQEALERGLARLKAEDGVRLSFKLSALVAISAIRGAGPSWQAEPPKRDMVRDPYNGSPKWFAKRPVKSVTVHGETVETIQEVDGYDKKRGRAYPDAYRRYVLKPDPVLTILERARYELWRAALDVLVEDLGSALKDHVPLPSQLSYTPWEEPFAPETEKRSFFC